MIAIKKCENVEKMLKKKALFFFKNHTSAFYVLKMGKRKYDQVPEYNFTGIQF